MKILFALLLIASLLMCACGGAKKAEPTEVEIQWPDAAVLKAGQAAIVDAGVETGAENETPVPAADAIPAP